MIHTERHRFPRWALLLPALAFAFLTSYYSWTNNTHEAQLRRVYSWWFTGHYVIFDGYGAYAAQLKYLLVHPDATVGFKKFLHGYMHANTPLFSVLAALVSFTGLSILWSCFAVTIISSIATIGLFVALLRQRDPAMGPGTVACFYSFLFHPSMLSGWARPLPDMTAMALLLGFFWCIREFEQCHRKRMLGAAAILCVAGMATKTALYLLLPFVAIMFSVHFARAWRRSHWHVHPIAMLVALIIVAAPLAVVLMNQDSSSVRFLFHVLRSPIVHPPKAKEMIPILISALIFFTVTFNSYSLVLWYGWRKSLFREEFEQVLWVGLYLLQRIVFVGFSELFARARYGIPITASLLILALPGFEKLHANPRTRPLVYIPAAFNLMVWVVFLARL